MKKKIELEISEYKLERIQPFADKWNMTLEELLIEWIDNRLQCEECIPAEECF